MAPVEGTFTPYLVASSPLLELIASGTPYLQHPVSFLVQLAWSQALWLLFNAP